MELRQQKIAELRQQRTVVQASQNQLAVCVQKRQLQGVDVVQIQTKTKKINGKK